ncbi:carboxypeptidase regulatory-like domain-containing protein [Plantactinospora sp. WMMB334]|uniref:carboxypeptidase regulatory-like domain-containing protein n=1 Tax=Plantactinospora sp. WMMB334 TaxID=3404119 RepID=UPI003B9524BD
MALFLVAVMVVGSSATAASATTIRDIASPHIVTGHIHNSEGAPVPYATVTVLGTPIPAARADVDGAYRIEAVPEGEYDIRADAGGCYDQQQLNLVVDSDEILDFVLPQVTDGYGYSCEVATPNYIETDTVLPLTGDEFTANIALPFPFTFYDRTYHRITVDINGYLLLTGAGLLPQNMPIPSPIEPNDAIYPFWDDLSVDDAASIRTKMVGSAPYRKFVIEWRALAMQRDRSRRVDFEAVLHENGRIEFQYRDIADSALEKGGSATIGIEDWNGFRGLQYSYNNALIDDPTFALLFRPPPGGFIQGRITDRNDGLGVSGAAVRALRDGRAVRTATVGPGGFYRLHLGFGTYAIQAFPAPYGPNRSRYSTETSMPFVLDEEDQIVTRDLSLRTARAEATPTALDLVVPYGQTRTRPLKVSNTGSSGLAWTASDPVPWLSATPTGGAVVPTATQAVEIRVNATGLPVGVHDTTITIDTNGARRRRLEIPVRVVVTDYHRAVNAGGPEYTDPLDDLWSADRQYAPGSWGYTNPRSATSQTDRPIDRTTEDPLYQTLRYNPVEYRFDGLPDGVYEVDLRFVEMTRRPPNTRLVDLIAEDAFLIPAYDIVAAVGNLAADQRVFHVRVTDGQLNLRFVERYGFAKPVVSGIQVTHRPDRP